MAQQGHIHRLGNSWWFIYKEKVDGKWKNRSKRLASVDEYPTASQVEKEFAQSLRDLRNGLDSAKLNPSTSQLVSDFIEHVYFPAMAAPNAETGVVPLKDSTLFGYRHLFNRHVKPVLNGEAMRQIDRPAAQVLLNKIAARTKLSSKSLAHIKWFMKAIFDFAQNTRAYDGNLVNPFEKCEVPKTTVRSNPTRYATLESIFDMLDALDDTSAAVVALAAFSGLRKSEIQGLKWGDIRDEEIHVERSAWRTTKVDETKTPASRDSVPVISMLADYLEEHRNGHPEEFHVFVGSKNTSKNRPLDLHNLANRVIRPVLEKCENCGKSRLQHDDDKHPFELSKTKSIPWCGWHGFRRGLATNLYTLKTPDTTIQRILRHADVKVTQASYIKVEENVRTAAMNRFNRVLKAKLAARKKAKKSRAGK